MSFSVIIPTLNEEENIVKQINHIKTLNPNAEIIVSDGGSSDKTVELALKNEVIVLHSKSGRGNQQRAAAMLASNDILIFLHCDTKLPEDAFKKIIQSFISPSCLIATFRISFKPQYMLLRMVSLFSRFDTPITRFGDQCIVIRREFYYQLGGFPAWKLMEDVYLLEKARRYTIIQSIPSTVISSSRKFQRNGVTRQLLWNAWLMLLYYLGRSTDRLAEMYRRKL